MKANRSAVLSAVGLLLLAIVAIGLSVAAILHVRPVDPIPATPADPSSEPGEQPAETPQAGETPSNTPRSPRSNTPSESSTAPAGDGPRVVIIGDRFSAGDPGDTWVGAVADELGWGEIVSLANPGRGFLTRARDCTGDACGSFADSVDAIAGERPDIVVTFGGTADGDTDLREAARVYFQNLRSELPDAELIAISPVTTEDRADYWLTLHNQSIRAGVTSVNGTFIDVGQPGLGSGENLDAEAQQEIADKIVAALS